VRARLYERLLGEAWNKVDEPVRRLHGLGSGPCGEGLFAVRGGSFFARALARLLGLLSGGEGVRVCLSVTHAVMGIIYGAMLANLAPTLPGWWRGPTALAAQTGDVPRWLLWSLTLMAAGVTLSGARDLYAALALPRCGWPWETGAEAARRGV